MTNKPMTLLVVLEQHFVRDGNEVYTDVQCSEEFWSRYLDVFEHLIVCARMRDVSEGDNLDSMLHSSRPEVEFVAMPDFVGATGPVRHHHRIKKSLLGCISRSDAAIIRVPSPISLVACPVLNKAGIPWAIEMMANPRTAYSRECLNHPLQPIIQSFITWQTKKVCLQADGVSYVTSSALQEEYPCQAIITSDGCTRFTASYSTISLHESDYSCLEWGTEAPREVLLAHTGKMTDNRKGHIIFLETVAKLRTMGVEVRGILIGDGPERSRFEGIADDLGVKQHCDFVGWKSGFSEVQRELQRAHFLVMPTKSEGLPRAVIEAMASGLLCLGNDVDGMPELLPAECLAERNTSDEYAEMIYALLCDWKHALEVRNRQHIKSWEYRNNLLEDRRRTFYSSLRDAACEVDR